MVEPTVALDLDESADEKKHSSQERGQVGFHGNVIIQPERHADHYNARPDCRFFGRVEELSANFEP